ncbi:MAG: hypothetical protein WB041_00855, partial [Pseudolabrys sp.]
AVLLWLWELFWCDALDLTMSVGPNYDALEGDCVLLAAASFRHGERRRQSVERLAGLRQGDELPLD